MLPEGRLSRYNNAMKPHQVISTLLFVGVFSLAAFAQDTVQWKNYVDSASEIWFQAPTSILIDHDAELKQLTLHTFFEGVRVSVRKQEVNGEPLKYVKGLNLPFGEKAAQVRNYKSDTIYVRREDELIGSDALVTLYIGSKQSYFVVNLAASKDNAAMKRFVETMRLGGSRLFSDPNIQDRTVNGEPVVFDRLPTSREIESALAKKSNGPEPAGNFGKLEKYVPLELDKLSGDVIILRKPRPGYTDDARMRGIQGTIFVNVQFLANGEIGNITVSDRADRGLGTNVIIAVRKIKFIPAQANGKAIDVTRTLQYKFSIY